MAYYKTYMPNELGELQKVVINAGVGFVLPFYGETAPPGTLACDGSEISRETYHELFTVLGTKAGAGDGSTTFNLPDFRGCFIRGTGGNAAALGVEQGDAIREISGSFSLRRLSAANGMEMTNASGVFSLSDSKETHNTVSSNTTERQAQVVNFISSKAVPTAAENRPVNVALLWCIIYE